MAGNDLVDLQQAARDSDWQRKGYLQKIFLPAEEQLIVTADDPQSMLWLLWTMKEASYKVMNRISGIRSYAPRSYVCSGLVSKGPETTASVTFNGYHLFIKTERSKEMIHSAAALSEKELEQLSVHYLDNSPGYMSAFNESCPEYILSKTPAGLPVIMHLPSSQLLEASVSHHGRYAAIVHSAPLCSGFPRSGD